METPEPTRTPLGPWTRQQHRGTVLFCWALLVGGFALLWRYARHVAAAESVSVGEAAFNFAQFLGVACLGLLGLLTILRGGTWLHGSVLSVRGPFRTRSVDLAAATVRGEIDDPADGRVTLVAHDDAAGRRVSLNLGTVDRIEFTPEELDALADAIDTVRSGPPADEETLRIAGRLRLFYRRPYPVGRYLWADPPIPPLRRFTEVDESDRPDHPGHFDSGPARR
ncbi:hypothetical protein [Catellatospora vulcania]|uniref:hypothetical protein n=1 Tax=Catellatospora vulcania TaxID=1460450 RepID=UPI0012D4A32F|nr:hypothetical protein [Catellatospora vulcania]